VGKAWRRVIEEYNHFTKRCWWVETAMCDLFIALIPACELEDDDDIYCAECEERLDNACLCDDGYYCESCMKALIDELEPEAEAYALENCKITGPIHRFDKSFENRCTREEYEGGSKESYTENSVRCYNRHCRTNYDELIKHLDKDSPQDRVCYHAIRTRIDQLLEEEHERLEDEEQYCLLYDEEQDGAT
jgi:hypothetical protein